MRTIDYYNLLEKAFEGKEVNDKTISALEMFGQTLRNELYKKQAADAAKLGIGTGLGNGFISGANYAVDQEVRAATLIRTVVREELDKCMKAPESPARTRAEDDGVCYDDEA